jgi:HK97 family phage major capsid protein
MKTAQMIELERHRLDLVTDARAALADCQSNTDSKARPALEKLHDDAMRALDANALDLEQEKIAAASEADRAAQRPHMDGSTNGSATSSDNWLSGQRSNWVDQRGNPVRVLTRDQRMADGPEGSVGFGDLVRAKITGARNADEERALSEGTDSAGGFTVPTPLSSRFIDRLRAKSVVMQAGAQTVPMESATLAIARLETDPDAGWRAENALIAEGDPTFSRVLFDAKSLAGKLVISRELAADSLNIGAMIENAFAQSMAIKLDLAALYGDGTGNAPTGVWNAAGISSVSMGTNGAALASYDRLLDAMLALKDANAMDPTAMICAPRTEIALAKLKNADQDPLRMPEMLSRIPLLSTTSAPVDEEQGTATTASSIVFGDFRELMIGMRQKLEIRIFDQPLAATGQLLVIAWMRADVQLATPKSFARLTGIIPS